MKVVGNMSKLTDKDDNIILPVTSAQVTFMDDGTTSANTAIRNIENDLTGCKIGVDGKEYPTLGARLDAEAQDLVNRLNENKFNKLSGDSIQAKNSLHGFTRNTMIEGETLTILTGFTTPITDFNVTNLAVIVSTNIASQAILSALDTGRKYTLSYSIELNNLVKGSNPRVYFEIVVKDVNDQMLYKQFYLDTSGTSSVNSKLIVLDENLFPENTIKEFISFQIAGGDCSGRYIVRQMSLIEGDHSNKYLGLMSGNKTNSLARYSIYSLGNEKGSTPFIDLITTNRNILYRNSNYSIGTRSTQASITEVSEGMFTVTAMEGVNSTHYGDITYKANIRKGHRYILDYNIVAGQVPKCRMYSEKGYTAENMSSVYIFYYNGIPSTNSNITKGVPFEAKIDCEWLNLLIYVDDNSTTTVKDITLIDLGVSGEELNEVSPLVASDLKIPLPSNCGGLMRLGTDTDRIYTSADKVILEKRIKKIVLNGDAVNETWTVNTDSSLNNDKTVLVTLSNTSIKFPKDIDTTNKLGCISDLVLYKDDAFNNYNYECFGIGGDRNALGNIDVRFLKTRFEQGANTTETIANLRAFLAANPLTIYYPSVEPDIYDLPVGSLELPTYNGETNITCVGSSFDLHASNISTEVPQDGGAVLADLQKANYNLQVSNSDLQAQIYQLQIEKNQGILMSLDMFENMLTLHQNLIIPASVKAGYKNMVELGLRNINSVPEVLRDEIKQMLGMKKE